MTNGKSDVGMRRILLEGIVDSVRKCKIPQNRENVQVSESLQIVSQYPIKQQEEVLEVIEQTYRMATTGWSALKSTRVNQTLREPIIVVRTLIYAHIMKKGELPSLEEFERICQAELIHGQHLETSDSYKPVVRGRRGLSPSQKSVKYRQTDREI